MKVRVILPFAGRIVCWMSERDAVKLWELGPRALRSQHGVLTPTMQALIDAATRGLVNYYRRAHEKAASKATQKVGRAKIKATARVVRAEKQAERKIERHRTREWKR